MIPRTLAPQLRSLSSRHPVVALTGPRQSGKTTLARATFPDHPYISLERPDERRFAMEDPLGFLARFDGPVVLDEVQRVPELFSYIQVLVDEEGGPPGRFILTGSQNFLLLEAISQSLAGRVAFLTLLPFSLAELEGRAPLPLTHLGENQSLPRPRSHRAPGHDLNGVMFRGFYPRIHDRDLPAQEWLEGYLQSYVERDVRRVVNVGDIEAFERFLRLCAGRSGQRLNLSSLAADTGVSQPTARRWLSVLEASYLVTRLPPFHRNFGKRITKQPKLYFLDVGLLCTLLRIHDPSTLDHREERGAIFETLVVAEFFKNTLHRGTRPHFSYWRDARGREVDLIIEQDEGVRIAEIKSSQTVASDFLDGLHRFRTISGDAHTPAALIYGGETRYHREGVSILPWSDL